MIEELIPIVLFTVTAIVFWLFFLYRHKSRAEAQKTVRLALEKGSELSPEFIKSISEPEPPANRDLRRGLIWLALAIGLALCGLATAQFAPEALWGCLAGAAFPVAIGVAYLIMWKYGSRTEAL